MKSFIGRSASHFSKVTVFETNLKSTHVIQDFVKSCCRHIENSAGSRPLYKEGGGLQKNFFWPLGPHFGLIIIIRGEGAVPPLDPPLENTTGSCQIRTTKGVITDG